MEPFDFTNTYTYLFFQWATKQPLTDKLMKEAIDEQEKQHILLPKDSIFTARYGSGWNGSGVAVAHLAFQLKGWLAELFTDQTGMWLEEAVTCDPEKFPPDDAKALLMFLFAMSVWEVNTYVAAEALLRHKSKPVAPAEAK